jgi:hypothetical protein
MGVWVAWANRSNCFSVGCFVPFSQDGSAGKRNANSSGASLERSRAQLRRVLLMGTLTVMSFSPVCRGSSKT